MIIDLKLNSTAMIVFAIIQKLLIRFWVNCTC